MSRFLLKISYDGSDFAGWQLQEKQVTVQGVLEEALAQLSSSHIRITGSSRTDAGVHAVNQFAHFDFNKKMETNVLKNALNYYVNRKDIIIKQVYRVDDDFHSRFDATARKYHYYITKDLTPFNRKYAVFFPTKKIDPKYIQKCLPSFRGEKNFRNFCKYNPAVKNYICNIQKLEFEEDSKGYVLIIKADRFLHNLVRRIIGTLLEISHKRFPVSIIEELLENDKKNEKIIWTAPAQGLFLQQVYYNRLFA